ncbi:MAG: carboxypeptidase regulatory-like domain-containing protein [Acidobacteriaceae bacterium]|nr:carboxypeptidase regulatory-like domain-containing protein [Acidobacteriaceae bacterium]
MPRDCIDRLARKRCRPRRAGAVFAILLVSFTPRILFAQLTTGIVDGIVRDSTGHPQAGVEITAIGSFSAFGWSTKSNVRGEFQLILPHGDYELQPDFKTGLGSSVEVHVFARRVRHVSFTLTSDLRWGAWTAPTQPWLLPSRGFTESYSFAGTLLNQEPATVTEPLDFTGTQNTRIPLASQRSFSWTATAFSLEGMNATDPYQSGRPIVFPDTQALDEMTVKSSVSSEAPAINLFLRTPGRRWHGELASSGTGAALTSNNLPSPADRWILQQPQEYNWFTRDHVNVGGPLGPRADVYFSGTGQWASETVPIARPGHNQNSRLLFANIAGRYGITAKDQLEFLLTGSRINLSDWGEPVGLEALTGWRMMPAYESPYGFRGLAEEDSFNFIQAEWTRQLPESFHSGVLQVRYSASIAHTDTKSSMGDGQSRTELLDGTVIGSPPLANFAIRQRQSVRAVLQPGDMRLGSGTQQIAIGGGWERSNATNRFTAASDLDLITAAGVPAYAVELNTPVDSNGRVESFSIFARDQIRPARWLSMDLGVIGEFSRGSLPPQESPAGAFAPARNFAGQVNVIAWNTASPHTGFTLAVPGFERLSIGGTYSRFYAPLAARYLDFANPNSLSGLVFSWNDINGDRVFQPGEFGSLLRRFGGAYSNVSPSLHSPHADEFDVYGAVSLSSQSSARIQLFRRDDKDRIAAMDTGVPAQAYQPVQILDPGPDGIPGTFDDRLLTVYEQNPSTFGADKFLLENLPDLRMLYEGFTAELFTGYKQLSFHASFTAEKSFGPTNPGNGPIENDPGIVGALYQDPNTLINATGHDFFDRSFLGKIQIIYRLPSKIGGIELVNVAAYLDGLPFARELLVTGLAQGPMVVGATIRGSPEGGNRAEYALNWNLRLARSFPIPRGQIRFSADLLNVTNSGNRIQENDISGPNFNERLPVAIQAPRSLRLAVGYTF